MTKKRRVFDIDFDDADVDVPAGTDAETRRGPMAAAITENADAVHERQTAEAQIRAENDKLAHEYVALKKTGLIVDLIPLDLVDTSKLIRDRAATRDDEIDELKDSIKSIGLSNPIRVEQDGDRYQLVQGWRRLTAYRELYDETNDAAFATIPAGLMARGETMDALYRRMVDENLVRRDISFAEMAALAVAYANDTDPSVADPAQAVDVLFASVSRQKRSYIRHFTTLVVHLGDDLKFSDAIPRKLGLDIVKRMDRDPTLARHIRDALRAASAETADAELAVLRPFADAPGAPKTPKAKPARGSSKTTLKLVRPDGIAKCTAAAGRIEVQLDRDFSAVDRLKLIDAVQAFLDQIDD